MRPDQQHKIRHLSLEVQAPWEASAQDIHNRIKRALDDNFFAELSGKLDGMVGADELLKLQNLEIDLGPVMQDHLEEDFREKLQKEFINAILGHLEEASLMGGNPAESQGTQDLVSFYLKHGGLPWWFEGSSLNVTQKLQIMVHESGPLLIEMLRAHHHDRQFMARLILALGAAERTKVFQLLAGESGGRLTSVMQTLEARVTAEQGGSRNAAERKNKLWLAAFSQLVKVNGKQVDAARFAAVVWQQSQSGYSHDEDKRQAEEKGRGRASIGEALPGTEEDVTTPQDTAVPDSIVVEAPYTYEKLFRYLNGSAKADDATRQQLETLTPEALAPYLRMLNPDAPNLQRWLRSLAVTDLDLLMRQVMGSSFDQVQALQKEWLTIVSGLPFTPAQIQESVKQAARNLLQLSLTAGAATMEPEAVMQMMLEQLVTSVKRSGHRLSRSIEKSIAAALQQGELKYQWHTLLPRLTTLFAGQVQPSAGAKQKRDHKGEAPDEITLLSGVISPVAEVRESEEDDDETLTRERQGSAGYKSAGSNAAESEVADSDEVHTVWSEPPGDVWKVQFAQEEYIANYAAAERILIKRMQGSKAAKESSAVWRQLTRMDAVVMARVLRSVNWESTNFQRWMLSLSADETDAIVGALAGALHPHIIALQDEWRLILSAMQVTGAQQLRMERQMQVRLLARLLSGEGQGGETEALMQLMMEQVFLSAKTTPKRVLERVQKALATVVASGEAQFHWHTVLPRVAASFMPQPRLTAAPAAGEKSSVDPPATGFIETRQPPPDKGLEELAAWLADKPVATDREIIWQRLGQLKPGGVAVLMRTLRTPGRNLRRWLLTLPTTQLDQLLPEVMGTGYIRLQHIRAEWVKIEDGLALRGTSMGAGTDVIYSQVLSPAQRRKAGRSVAIRILLESVMLSGRIWENGSLMYILMDTLLSTPGVPEEEMMADLREVWVQEKGALRYRWDEVLEALRQSSGTEALRRSSGTAVLRQSSGTEALRQSPSTGLSRNSATPEEEEQNELAEESDATIAEGQNEAEGSDVNMHKLKDVKAGLEEEVHTEDEREATSEAEDVESLSPEGLQRGAVKETFDETTVLRQSPSTGLKRIPGTGEEEEQYAEYTEAGDEAIGDNVFEIMEPEGERILPTVEQLWSQWMESFTVAEPFAEQGEDDRAGETAGEETAAVSGTFRKPELSAGNLLALIQRFEQDGPGEIAAVLSHWAKDERLLQTVSALPQHELLRLVQILVPAYAQFLPELEEAFAAVPSMVLRTPVTGTRFWEPVMELVMGTPVWQISRRDFIEQVLQEQVAILKQAFEQRRWQPRSSILQAWLTEAGGAVAAQDDAAVIRRWIEQTPAYRLPDLVLPEPGSADLADGVISPAELLSVFMQAIIRTTGDTPEEVRTSLKKSALAGALPLSSKLTGNLDPDPTWVPARDILSIAAMPREAEMHQLIQSAATRPAEWQGLLLMSGIWSLSAEFPAIFAALPEAQKVKFLDQAAPGYSPFVLQFVEDAAFIAGKATSVDRAPTLQHQQTAWEQFFRLFFSHRPGTSLQGWVVQGFIRSLPVAPAQVSAIANTQVKQLKLGRIWQAHLQQMQVQEDKDNLKLLEAFILHGQLPLGTESAQLRARLLVTAAQQPRDTLRFLRSLGAPAKVARTLNLLLSADEYLQLVATLGMWQQQLLRMLIADADTISSQVSGFTSFGAAFREAVMELTLGPGWVQTTVDLGTKVLALLAGRMGLTLPVMISMILHPPVAGSVHASSITQLAAPLERAFQTQAEAPAPAGEEELIQFRAALKGEAAFPAASVIVGLLDATPSLHRDVIQVLKRSGPLHTQLSAQLNAEALRVILRRQHPAAVDFVEDVAWVLARYESLQGQPADIDSIWRQLLMLGLPGRVTPQKLPQKWITSLRISTADDAQRVERAVSDASPLFRHPLTLQHFRIVLGRMQGSVSRSTTTATTTKQRPDSGSNPYKRLEPEGPEVLAEFAVSNAGLVILWPFFDRYFDMLGLLRKGKFRGKAAQERAVFLLQYLCNGVTRPDEADLVLPKVFCGLDPGVVLKAGGIRPKPEEKEVTHSLLEAAVFHWRALGETSVPTFQETFTFRPGELLVTENRYLLRVAPRSYDLLLKTLPWSLNPVNLSWMQKLMQVEWK